MEKYGPETYGDLFACVYDEWYGDDGNVALTIMGNPEVVAEKILSLAEDGPVLELGIGSGRLALPIAKRGLDVTGVDASEAMLDLLRAKPGSEAVTLIKGDMVDPPGLEPETFSLILVGFNTFFNLPSQKDQESCIAAVKRLLKPGGRFVIEAFVPDPKTHDGFSIRSIEVDRILADAVLIDEEKQTITGQRIEMTSSGNRLFPYFLRYAYPSQLDEMATKVGLSLEHRWEDWLDSPFTEESVVHISVWKKSS